MFDDLRELYTDLLNDHNRKPHNFCVLPDASRHAQGANPICGDNFTVYLKLDGDVIKDVSFQGKGCAYSTASASMMTDFVKGKTVSEAQRSFEDFRQFIKTGQASRQTMETFGAFSSLCHQPLRAKCATLAWHAMFAAVKGDSSASTEGVRVDGPPIA